MRADEGADAALDTDGFVPDRDVDGDVALLVLRCGGREGAVCRHEGYGQVVAEAGDDLSGDVLDEFRGGLGDGRRHFELAGGFGRNLDFVDVLEGFVYGGVVHGNDLVARFAVALLDGVLDLFQRGVQRDDVGDLEEGGLHDDVDAGAQAQLFTQLDGVDDVEFQFLVDDLLLDFFGHLVPDFVHVRRGSRAGRWRPAWLWRPCRISPGRRSCDRR